MPAYNVQDYVVESVQAVLDQDYKNIELIVVDDGSTDETANRVLSVASSDGRVRLIRQKNMGPGAARNEGIKAASGIYLTFVDADDRVPRAGIAYMVDSISASGSDFVVGAIARDTGSAIVGQPWAERVHSSRRVGITVDEWPEVLKNVFPCTKLFRTSFFRSSIGDFPTGHYEDQEFSLRAFLRGRFDVLPDVVYHWAIRGDSSSITQQKHLESDLLERIEVIRACACEVLLASETVRRHWFAKALGFDLRPYYTQAARAGEGYRTRLRSSVMELVEAWRDDARDLMLVSDRFMYLAVAGGHWDDLRELVKHRERFGWHFPTTVDGEYAYVRPEVFQGYEISLSKTDRALLTETRLRWALHSSAQSDRALSIRGWAYVEGVGGLDHQAHTRLVIHHADGKPSYVQGVGMLDPRVDDRAQDPFISYANRGVEFCFDLSDPRQFRSGELSIEIACGEFRHRTPLKLRPSPDNSAFPLFGQTQDGVAWSVSPAQDGRLSLEVGGASPVIESIEMFGHVAIVDLKSPVPKSGRIVATNGRSRVVAVPVGESRYKLDLTPPQRETGRTQDWRLALNDGQLLRWSKPELCAQSRTASSLRPLSDDRGNASLRRRPVHATITEIGLVDGRLQASGFAWGSDLEPDGSGAAGLTLIAKGSRESVEFARLDVQDTSRADGAVQWSASLSAETLVGRGAFAILMRHGSREIWPNSGAGLKPALYPGTELTLDLARTPKTSTPYIRIHRMAGERIFSAYSKLASVVDYQAMDLPLEDAVMIEAFGGSSLGDSGRAIGEELLRVKPSIKQYWVVDSTATRVPRGVVPVLFQSDQWFRLLATSRYLINNNNFPWYFRKRSGQVYVQTWHGTPIKKIGNDVPSQGLSLSYRDHMKYEVESWDYLVAQNGFSSAIFPHAFGYTGSILEFGYPRNDVLAAGGSRERRDAAREMLGCSTEDTVVLYAPTWRDNVKAAGHYGKVAHLDLDVLGSKKGEHTYRVLFRGHSNTANSQSTVDPRMLDVSSHPDLNDLIFASDVLITDYSSIMFDYIVTGKPVYYLTPDLEEYSTSTRGFYEPLEDIAPSPLCKDTSELVEAMSRDYWAEYGDRYRAMVKRFAPMDDGHAAARVVEHIFGKGDDEPGTGA